MTRSSIHHPHWVRSGTYTLGLLAMLAPAGAVAQRSDPTAPQQAQAFTRTQPSVGLTLRLRQESADVHGLGAPRLNLTPIAPYVSPTRRDFRWEGTVLGAIGVGILGGLEGAAYCNNSENGPRSCTGTAIGFAAAGVALGAVAGYFLGRLLHK